MKGLCRKWHFTDPVKTCICFKLKKITFLDEHARISFKINNNKHWHADRHLFGDIIILSTPICIILIKTAASNNKYVMGTPRQYNCIVNKYNID